MSHLCSLPLLLIFPTVWDLRMNRFDVGGHPCLAPNLGEHVQYFTIGKVLVTQSCLTLCDPMDLAHHALLSLGFSRQEYWSG